MSIERSHGKARLQTPRLRDMSAPQSTDSKPRRVDQRTHRPAKRALLAALRSALAVAGGAAGRDANAPQNGAQALADQALTLYRAARRELGTDSPIALSAVLRWSVQTIIAQQLELAAARLDLASPEAARLLERAAVAAGRAERASVAALTMARALAKPGSTDAPAPWLEAADDDDGGEL